MMSGYRKLLAVGAGLGMLLVGAVAAPAAADPPNDPEVIRVQIYSVRYEGLWANARFSGACPADFPYLTDKKFSNDRILPLGVIIDTAPSVATLVVATSSEKRIEGRKEFVAVKSIDGGQFPPTVVSQLAGVVRGGDDGGIAQVERRQVARQYPSGDCGQPADARRRIDERMADPKIGSA